MTAAEERRLEALSADLRKFQYRVAMPAQASSRLMFAIMVALAAPVWRALGRSPFCFHLYGSAASRETLALVAASLYGKLELTQWAAVSIDPKPVAAGTSDGLLVLVEDEEPHRAGRLNAIAALWADHRGIAIRSQPIPNRLDALALSLGDTLIDQALVFAAVPVLRGGLRLVDVPLDAGQGHGLFEEAVPAAYAEFIAIAMQQTRGSVGVHWLRLLSRDWDSISARLTTRAPGLPIEPTGAVDVFMQLPVEEIYRAFRTVAMVGELATEMGLTGWRRGDASAAVAACEQAWRGGNAMRLSAALGEPWGRGATG